MTLVRYGNALVGLIAALLLDDNGIGGLDLPLAAMDSHPHIHVRLFNPFVLRGAKWLGFVTDFSRVNRRMHNKSMTADNTLTVVGGRNIGDEYFGATPGALFVDLDLLALGAAATVSRPRIALFRAHRRGCGTIRANGKARR